MTDIPQQLLALANEQRPTKYAIGVMKHFEEDLKMALNYEQVRGELSWDSFVSSVHLAVATDERLAKAMMAAPGSFIKALSLAAQCKLLVGGSYDLFYLIPRWNKKLRFEEVSPMIGYKGLTTMAQRHPRVHKVEAFLVYEGEKFSYDPGLGKCSHEVNMLGERSQAKCIGGYARVVITEPSSTHPVMDDPVIHVMNRAEIDAIMERSDAYTNATAKGWNNSPWHTDWKPMARKTLIRAVLNGGSVPRDMGIGMAIQADDDATTFKADIVSMPKTSVKDAIRQELGLDDKLRPFDFAEEAVAALDDCETIEQMEALKPAFQHFQRGDADVVAKGWATNEARLRGDE